MFSTILSTDTLAAHLEDPNWVIIDARYDLAKPDWGHEIYLEQHIPGAIYASLGHDLAAPVRPETGRHPLPDDAAWQKTVSGWGITPETQVVVYDVNGGAFADRTWWMLRHSGHEAVAVLDGGLPKWTRESRPTRGGAETRPPYPFHGMIDASAMVSTAEVDRLRLDPAWRLVDARSPERYRGESEPIDAIAGHIPGAVNRFHGLNLTPEGVLKAPDVLRAEFDALLGDTPADHVAVYCGSGVTSIFHLLAMEMAGLPGGKLYVGSWSEWIRDPNRPIG